MSEAKYTPGPWALSPAADGDYDIGQEGDIHVIACVYGDGEALPNAQTLADARLIASAPELLAVAQMVIEAYDDSGDWQSVANAARAVIAKAEGTNMETSDA